MLFWILFATRAIVGVIGVELLLSAVAFAVGWVALFVCVILALVASIAAALGACKSFNLCSHGRYLCLVFVAATRTLCWSRLLPNVLVFLRFHLQRS